MDVLEMRVPEYTGRKCSESAPQSPAMKKSDYIEDRKAVIRKINNEIADLRARLKNIENPEDYYYRYFLKRLKKCYEIKENCESSIALAAKHMEIEKNSRIR